MKTGKLVALAAWVWAVATVFLAIVTHSRSYVDRLIDAGTFFGMIATAIVLVIVGAAFLDRWLKSDDDDDE